MAKRSFRIDVTKYNTHRRIGLKKWENGFRALLRAQERRIRTNFRLVTRAFLRNKVAVTSQRGVRMSGGDMEVVVGVLENTSGNRTFSYVNWGTGPRTIYPRKRKQLVYRPWYRRATVPGRLSVSPPWKKEGPLVKYDFVNHPGIKARRFDLLIQYIMIGHMQNDGKKKVAELAKSTWRARNG